MFEDDLIPIFESSGHIWDLRLMVDPLTGFNRGYAFITYCIKEDAQNAQLKVIFDISCPKSKEKKFYFSSMGWKLRKEKI